MRNQVLSVALFVSVVGLSAEVRAANPEHLKQLIATKQCQQCDLSGAGLVRADLRGADLSGANLIGANLSRANLSGADLTGANLSGTGLFGANLSAAKLAGANLLGADLRNTYLMSVDLTGVDLRAVNLQGAVGIPLQSAQPQQFYAWGVAAAQQGNQQQAIDYFEQAIAAKPDYAGAYLARGIARFQIFDRKGAFEDAQLAEKMFTSQNNREGVITAQAFIQELQAPLEPKLDKGKPSFTDFVGSLGSVLLQFLPF